MSKNRLALPAVFLLLSPALAFGDESVETAAAKARAQLPRAAAYAKHSLNGIPADEQRQLIAEANSRFARIDAAQEFIRNSAEFLGLQSAQGRIYATYQNKHAQYITERYTCKDDVCRDRVEKKRTQLDSLYYSEYYYHIDNIRLRDTDAWYGDFSKSIAQANAIAIRIEFARLFNSQKIALRHLYSWTPARLTKTTAQIQEITAKMQAIQD